MRIKIGKFEDSEKGGGRMDDRKIKKILDHLAAEKENWEKTYNLYEHRLESAYARKNLEDIIASEKMVEFFKGRLMSASTIKTEIEKILRA